jgi:GntR family transcriptional regulator
MPQTPLYEQVASEARTRIARGDWSEGDRLPSERELSIEYGVSRATLRQALDALENGGLITRHRGRGTFVAGGRPQLPLIGAFSISDAMRAMGVEMVTRVVDVRVAEADRSLAADLACMPGDDVVSIQRLRYGDDEPLVLDSVQLRAELFPGLPEADFERRALYEIIETDYGRTIAGAQETLEPVILTPSECELLEVPRHTTALLNRRITTDPEGTVLALGYVLLRGDRSRYIYSRSVRSQADRR